MVKDAEKDTENVADISQLKKDVLEMIYVNINNDYKKQGNQ